PLRAYVHLDNQRRELKPFDYYPDPTFHDLPKSIISVTIQFGNGEWVVGSVEYESKSQVPLAVIITSVVLLMAVIIGT
ncbi:hypothetical protein CRUP_025656, partial [Coryphaenoides rupestris]